MVMMLIGFSVAFGYMMAIMQIPATVTKFFLGLLRWVFIQALQIRFGKEPELLAPCLLCSVRGQVRILEQRERFQRFVEYEWRDWQWQWGQRTGQGQIGRASVVQAAG